ncbi:MFS transporter [Dehalobacter sp. DCM]|uniref:MFS transporter n=1 Tax=Dehalobacter sp. DCM TaxID=2907827 RepID=UPI003081B0CC|nr:MFS transporter [Dehalobacter sp. DCM]
MAGNASGGATYFDGHKINNTQRRFLWVTAFVYVFDQMDNATFQNAAPTLMKRYGITAQQIGDINFYNFFGAFIGAVFGGWLADKIGRKKAILTTVSVFSLGSLGNAIFTVYPLIAASRLITGMGCIATVVIAMVYISEMMPSEKRGRYQAITIASGTISLPLIGMFAAYIIPKGPDNWRIVFLLGALGIILVFIGASWLRESPRWLVTKGRTAEAEKIVEEVTGGKCDLSQEAARITRKASAIEALRVMFGKGYIKRTIVLFILTIGVTGGSMLFFNFYSTALVMGGMAMPTVLMVISLSLWGIPTGDFLSSFYTDLGGRKLPLFICMVGLAVTYVLAGMTLVPVILIIVMFFQKIVGSGCNTMLWTYLAESYPTNVRTNAVGYIFGTVRLLISFCQLAVPGLYAAYHWMGINMINAAIIVIPAVVLLVWGDKTSKISLEEVNKQAYLQAK